jgi:hypothetical protein
MLYLRVQLPPGKTMRSVRAKLLINIAGWLLSQDAREE